MKLRNKNTGEIGIINLTVIGDDLTYCYETLEYLLTEWEVAKPKQPKIIDEKNRKLVREWSKLYDTESIRIYKRGEYISLYKDEVPGYSLSVGIDLPKNSIRDVEDDHYYSTIELCGEEE